MPKHEDKKAAEKALGTGKTKAVDKGAANSSREELDPEQLDRIAAGGEKIVKTGIKRDND